MMHSVMEKVNGFSEQMLLHYSAPNHGLIVEVMQLDANVFGDLSGEDLSKYILVLGQYLVMLQYNDNVKNIEHMLTQKVFDNELNKAKFISDIPKNVKTEKERKFWLLSENEALRVLDEEVLVAEAQKMLMSGMTKATEGLLNALKKEKSSRYAD